MSLVSTPFIYYSQRQSTYYYGLRHRHSPAHTETHARTIYPYSHPIRIAIPVPPHYTYLVTSLSEVPLDTACPRPRLTRPKFSSSGASSKLPPSQVRARVWCSVPGETLRCSACSSCHIENVRWRTSDELAELLAAAAAGPSTRSPDWGSSVTTADCSCSPGNASVGNASVGNASAQPS